MGFRCKKLENKEIKEKIKNDLTSVEKEVIPVLEKVKELEKELKEIVKTKVQNKDFDLNKIAQIHKEKIKNEIKRIIDGENKGKPLSDQIISSMLGEKNMNISRRTVAKYREEIGIKASSMRKRL